MARRTKTYASVCTSCGLGCESLGYISGPHRDLDGVWIDSRGRRRTDVIPNNQQITVPVCHRSECWTVLRERYRSEFVRRILNAQG